MILKIINLKTLKNFKNYNFKKHVSQKQSWNLSQVML